MKITTVIGASLLATFLVACGSSDNLTDPPAGAGGAGGGAGGAGGSGGTNFALELQWQPCSLFSEGADMRAQCAEFDVPLHWANPEGDRISLFLKRHLGQPGGGQSWFLTGGPGQPASDMEALVDQLTTLDSNRTYYLLDHRGVGRSTRLRCPGSEGLESPNSIGLGEGEVEACLAEVRQQWSDAQLAGFSTVNAAHDLGQLIAHLRHDQEVVTLWGGSYGTLWLERYLSLYPEQASSAVFSAVAVDVDMLSVDRYVDDMARRWLDACDATPGCGERFSAVSGQGATQTAIATLGGTNTMFCPELAALGLAPVVLKPFFGQLLEQLETRAMVAPLIYRLARCAPEDVTAWQNLIAAVSPPGPQEIPYGIRNWGFVLGENIVVSELSQDRTADEIAADFDAAIAVQGITPRLAQSRAVWPRYEAPPFDNSSYQGAVLLLHGAYDFLPEGAFRRTVDHYLARGGDFVRVPHAPHSLESPTTDGGQCGLSMAVARILDPNAPVSDCVDRVLPPNFEPSTALSMSLLGTNDAWDGIPAATAAPSHERGALTMPGMQSSPGWRLRIPRAR